MDSDSLLVSCLQTPQKVPVITNGSEFNIIDTAGKKALNTQFWHWLISFWLASEGNEYNLTWFFKAMHILRYKIWKLFKIYPLCLSDMTRKFTKNHVHKFPCLFACENVTSSAAYGLLDSCITA